MKKILIPILFLIAVAIFVVIPSQHNSKAIGLTDEQTPSQPNSFLLDWSSDSYVPPDYQGKALAARNSNIRVVAVPINSSIKEPEKLYYNWQINDKKALTDSGLGRTVLIFKATGWPGETFKIKCQIFDSTDLLLTEKTITITLANPQILLYDPSGGYAFKNSVAAKTDQKLNFLAIPFFFRSNDPAIIDYVWQLDGQKLDNIDNRELDHLTLSIPPGEISEPFVKQLNLSITDKNDRLQQASTNLRIEVRP